MKQRRLLTIVGAGLAALALSACGGDDDGSDEPDFATADLEGLNFAPADLPDMEYQPNRSGPNAFERLQEADEDRSGIQLVADLKELGLEADYVSQFFATSRDAELNFVESTTFLFEDDAAAEDAVPTLDEANAANLESAEEIDAPDLGEQAFAVSGDFDGSLVYSFGWRVGDVIQVATVAPGDQNAGPESTIELAEQLEAKAQE